MSYDRKLVKRLRNGKDEVIDAEDKKKIANEIFFLKGELENLDAVASLLADLATKRKNHCDSLVAAMEKLIEHAVDCERQLDELRGSGGAGRSNAVAEAQAVIATVKE